MRIHLIQPNDMEHQSKMTGGVMLEEDWQNYLLSFAYRQFEPAYSRVWENLISRVESTRNS